MQFRDKLAFLLFIGLLATGYYGYTRRPVTLNTGECCLFSGIVDQTLVRESDNTTWCLSGVRREAIYWQWSPDNGRFAYALQDENEPSRQIKGGTNLPNLNWYIMDANGSDHKRFSRPDPYYFTFSSDGQYAKYRDRSYDITTYYEVISVETEDLICRYGVYSVWYFEENPSCKDVKLKDGSIWDIESEVDFNGCKYYVSTWGWSDQMERNGCRELLAETDLVLTPTSDYSAPRFIDLTSQPTPTPKSYPVPVATEVPETYP